MLACAPRARLEVVRPPREEEEPLERLTIGRGASVLNEHRGRGCSVRDFHEAYPAEAIGPGHAPVRAVERFRVDGRPLFFFRPDGSAVVVDATRASDLTVADATRLGAGQEVRVGRLAPATVAALGPREAVKLLLQAEAVRTYWHLEADLRLVAEREGPGGYEVDVDGEHVYYTNQRNEAALSFTVRVADDGTVTVGGRGR